MLEINESNFDQETRTGLVLLDFYATWCGPCRVLSPVLERLQAVKVLKIDVDENRELALRFDVQSIPKLVFLKDGQVVDELVGLQSEQTLQQRVNLFNS